jgi:hypothetical protein
MIDLQTKMKMTEDDIYTILDRILNKLGIKEQGVGRASRTPPFLLIQRHYQATTLQNQLLEKAMETQN